jgi:glycosyltransferase involved in cell wall biosynthesis
LNNVVDVTVHGDSYAPAPESVNAPRIMIVGSGWRFTSGISYYTCRLANAFAERRPTSALLMRSLVPRVLYPGRRRVGVKVNSLTYSPQVSVLDGIDWFWGRSMLAALRFLRSQRPDVLVLQWWTGAVLHSYLLLAVLAARRGTRVVLEWHEVQDTGEARIPGASVYVRHLMGQLLARCCGHMVHSEYDLSLLRANYDLSGPVQIAPHGPYDHLTADPAVGRQRSAFDAPDATSTRTVLSFGVIRPYKGVEDLVAAFDSLPDQVASRLRLVIAGETWEGWTAPLDAVAASPRRDQITVINEYIDDAEVSRLFHEADAVALPYRRSSASGPLHIAMSAGLPVLVSDVGGLHAAAGEYAGAVFTRPQDIEDIARGLTELLGLCGRSFADPHSWSRTLDAYDRLFEAAGILPPRARARQIGRQTQLTPDQLVSQVEALSSPTITGSLR